MAYWQGLFTGAGLIIAIGAQNAFVLTQALRRNHPLAVASVCALVDVTLISAGVLGLGTLVAASGPLKATATLGGAAFLFWFGARSLREARTPGRLTADASAHTGLAPTISATLAISLLNPHVYLDTVVMLGAISANYPGNGRYLFGAGACTASVVWFFSLSAAGALLAPVLNKASTWRVINVLVCAMVWWVGIGLVRQFFS